MVNDKEYELVQDDEIVAGTSGANAFNEIQNYAAQYRQDGPVEIYEVTRRKIHSAAAPQVVADEADLECQVPPFGWRCTRGAGHPGPCAAIECPEDVAAVKCGMARLAAASIPAQADALTDAYRALQNTLLVVPDGDFKRKMDDWLSQRLGVVGGEAISAPAPLKPVAVPDGAVLKKALIAIRDRCHGIGIRISDDVEKMAIAALAAPAAQGDAKGLTDEQIIEAVRDHFNDGDGGYLVDTARECVVAGVRAAIAAKAAS